LGDHDVVGESQLEGSVTYDGASGKQRQSRDQRRLKGGREAKTVKIWTETLDITPSTITAPRDTG